MTENTNGYRLENIRIEADRSKELSPPDKTYHGAVDLRLFLDGYEHTQFGVERDMQRQRLYRAQRFMIDHTDPETFKISRRELEYSALFIALVLQTAWWQRRYDVLNLTVRPGYGAKSATAATTNYGANRITLPISGRNRRTILHELIHLTVPQPHAGHGRLYCARYLEAITRVFGSSVGNTLREGYLLHDVRFQPRFDGADHCF